MVNGAAEYQRFNVETTSVARQLVHFSSSGELLVAFVSEAFSGLKNTSNYFVSST